MFTNRNDPKPNEETQQGKNQTFTKRKLVYRMTTFLSLLCSCLAVGQHAVESFCPYSVFQIEIFDTKYDCIQGLLLAAIILGILAVILSISEHKSSDDSSHDDPSSDTQEFSDKMQGHETEAKSQTNNKLNQSSQVENEVKASKVLLNATSHSEVNETSKTTLSETRPCLEKVTLAKKDGTSLSSGPPVVLYDERKAFETQKQKETTFQAANSKLSDHILQGLSRTWGLMPNNPISSNGIVEFTASRKLTYFPEGTIRGQEELKFSTIYGDSDDASPPLKTNFRERSKEEIRKRFNTFSTSLFTPQKDHVSEVATKMEALQFSHS